MNQWVADNELVVSKYAENLEHVDSGRKISSDPKTWVCEDSGKTENLWLNLSTGEEEAEGETIREIPLVSCVREKEDWCRLLLSSSSVILLLRNNPGREIGKFVVFGGGDSRGNRRFR